MDGLTGFIIEFFINPFGIAFIAGLAVLFLPKLLGIISERVRQNPATSSRTLVQFYLSLICASLISYLGVRFIYRPGRWAVLLVAITFVFFTVFWAVVFYTLANTEQDKNIADALRISFIDPLRRFRGWIADLWWDHRPGVVFLIVVGAIILAAGFYWASRPRPSSFLVYIDRNSIDEAEDGTADSFLTNIMDESSEFDELGIRLSDDPLDFQAADLRITLRIDNSDCKSDSSELVSWGWDATNRRQLNSSLLRYLEESDVVGSDNARALCIGGDNAMTVIAFITFANGLNHLLAEPPNTNAAIDNFRYIAENLEGMGDATAEGDDAQEISPNALYFPRRIKTCAELMAIVADGVSATNTDSDVERLEAIISSGPVAPEDVGHIDWETFDLSTEERAGLEYCHAQAYYWLGRTALMRHQIDLFADQSGADVATIYADQEETEPDTHPLDRANDYFTLALEASPNEFESTGYWWSYYFYRALARYRQGSLEQALDDLEAAGRTIEDHALNEMGDERIGKPAIDYLHARIELERVAYQGFFPTVCLGAGPQSDADTVLTDMRNMADENEYGPAPLSVGTMALFNEALFRFSRAPTDSGRVLDLLARARQQVAGDAGSSVENYSHIDVLRDKVYKFDGDSENEAPIVSEGTIKEFLVGAGSPAYVIPVSPFLLPGRYCGPADNDRPVRAHQLHRGNIRFVWLLRNRFDELIFDYQPFPPLYNSQEGDTGLEECDATFCVAVDNGTGERRYWRLNDRGFGLFMSDPVNPIHAALSAEPGPDGIIYLRGAPAVSLVYMAEGHDPKEILLGDLPVEVPARLEPDQIIGTISTNATDCDNCYDVNVTLSLASDAVPTLPVSLERLREMTFRATLYERLEDGEAVDSDDGQWQIIGPGIRMILDDDLRINGAFPSARIIPGRAHALQVQLVDRADVTMAEYWLKSLDIRVPE